jgi:hypothetical protein
MGMMSKYRIDQDFKTFGKFWEDGNEGNEFTGTLSSRKGVTRLTASPAYGALDDSAIRAALSQMGTAREIQKRSSIRGFTKLGNCSLLNIVSLGGDGLANFPTMQGVSRDRYRAMRTVMGLHIESSDTKVLDGAAYYFSKIHHLLPLPWKTQLTEGESVHTVPNKSQEVFRFASSYLDAEVICEVFEGGSNKARKGVRIKSVPRVRITPTNPKSVDWFASLAFRLENFFTLILGTSVGIKHVQLFQGDNAGWLIQAVRRHKEKVNFQTWVRCTNSDASKALEKWLSVPNDDQIIELTLLGNVRKSSLFGETEFLTLAQALEGFARIRFGGSKRRAAKFDDLIDQTYDLFSPILANAIVGEKSDFRLKVIQTRDFYTHLGNPKGSSAVKTMKELFLFNKRLIAFLRGAMLIDLGIPEENFSEAVIYQATRWK